MSRAGREYRCLPGETQRGDQTISTVSPQTVGSPASAGGLVNIPFVAKNAKASQTGVMGMGAAQNGDASFAARRRLSIRPRRRGATRGERRSASSTAERQRPSRSASRSPVTRTCIWTSSGPTATSRRHRRTNRHSNKRSSRRSLRPTRSSRRWSAGRSTLRTAVSSCHCLSSASGLVCVLCCGSQRREKRPPLKSGRSKTSRFSRSRIVTIAGVFRAGSLPSTPTYSVSRESRMKTTPPVCTCMRAMRGRSQDTTPFPRCRLS